MNRNEFFKKLDKLESLGKHSFIDILIKKIVLSQFDDDDDEFGFDAEYADDEYIDRDEQEDNREEEQYLAHHQVRMERGFENFLLGFSWFADSDRNWDRNRSQKDAVEQMQNSDDPPDKKNLEFAHSAISILSYVIERYVEININSPVDLLENLNLLRPGLIIMLNRLLEVGAELPNPILIAMSISEFINYQLNFRQEIDRYDQLNSTEQEIQIKQKFSPFIQNLIDKLFRKDNLYVLTKDTNVDQIADRALSMANELISRFNQSKLEIDDSIVPEDLSKINPRNVYPKSDINMLSDSRYEEVNETTEYIFEIFNRYLKKLFFKILQTRQRLDLSENDCQIIVFDFIKKSGIFRSKEIPLQIKEDFLKDLKNQITWANKEMNQFLNEYDVFDNLYFYLGNSGRNRDHYRRFQSAENYDQKVRHIERFFYDHPVEVFDLLMGFLGTNACYFLRSRFNISESRFDSNFFTNNDMFNKFRPDQQQKIKQMILNLINTYIKSFISKENPIIFEIMNEISKISPIFKKMTGILPEDLAEIFHPFVDFVQQQIDEFVKTNDPGYYTKALNVVDKILTAGNTSSLFGVDPEEFVNSFMEIDPEEAMKIKRRTISHR